MPTPRDCNADYELMRAKCLARSLYSLNTSSSTAWRKLLSCLVGSLETDVIIALSPLCDLGQGTEYLSSLLWKMG